MVAAVLAAGDPIQPLVGGRVDAMGSNVCPVAIWSLKPMSDRSFLKLFVHSLGRHQYRPRAWIVTGHARRSADISRVHGTCPFLRHGQDVTTIQSWNAFFREFIDVLTYGLRTACFLINTTAPAPVSFKTNAFHSVFRVAYKQKDGEFTLHVPGVHNVLLATASLRANALMFRPIRSDPLLNSSVA